MATGSRLRIWEDLFIGSFRRVLNRSRARGKRGVIRFGGEVVDGPGIELDGFRGGSRPEEQGGKCCEDGLAGCEKEDLHSVLLLVPFGWGRDGCHGFRIGGDGRFERDRDHLLDAVAGWGPIDLCFDFEGGGGGTT